MSKDGVGDILLFGSGCLTLIALLSGVMVAFHKKSKNYKNDKQDKLQTIITPKIRMILTNGFQRKL